MNSKYLVFVLAMAVIVTMDYVQAAPTGATVTAGTQERWAGQTAQTVTTEGGNVTEVNVSGYSVTDKWTGFYGQVSGGLRLADSSGNKFYEWTVSDVTGAVVYAANDTVSDWTSGNILPLNTSVGWLPSFLTTGTDSFGNTFTSQGTFTSASLNIANVNYTTTWNSTGVQGTEFKTYALRSVSDAALIWAAKAVADTAGFNGNSVDYQLLAGVNSLASNTQYYFYLELP